MQTVIFEISVSVSKKSPLINVSLIIDLITSPKRICLWEGILVEFIYYTYNFLAVSKISKVSIISWTLISE